MSDQIFDELRALRDEQTRNHTDVVQRLTRVETQLLPLAPLEERVRVLEGWKSTAAGIIIAANVAFAGAVEWFHRR
jgi:hypothetical protein